MKFLLIITIALFTALSHDNGLISKGSNTVAFVNPLSPNAEVQSGFGLRHHPVLNIERMHNGIDFKVSIGDHVHAAAEGTIFFTGREDTYGNFIEIQHENGFVTRYAQLSEFQDEMREGIKVKSGQHIAYAGNSGLVTGPTLHFEILLNGEAVDPLLYLE